MAAVSLKGIVKRFDKQTVVHGIDLAIADGEFVVLVGPSGCGKSTTLRMIAGLEDASDGEIRIGERVVNKLEPKDRNIAMVFQNYAIYPHMTVHKNIAFGLRMAKLAKAEEERRVRDAAAILGLTDLLERRPSQLSGGQRQRVAIGRAMVRDPAVFLFDEPLSNLDAQLRAQMRLEIKKLHQTLGTTIVYVTHDQIEAMTLADRIVIMRDGRILQIGTPTEVYRDPVDVFVARFIGSPSMNLIPGVVAPTGDAIEFGGTRVDLASAASAGAAGRRVLLGIRPDDLRVAPAPIAGAVSLAARVSLIEPLGPDTLVHAESGGHGGERRAERQRAVAAVMQSADHAGGQADVDRAGVALVAHARERRIRRDLDVVRVDVADDAARQPGARPHLVDFVAGDRRCAAEDQALLLHGAVGLADAPDLRRVSDLRLDLSDRAAERLVEGQYRPVAAADKEHDFRHRGWPTPSPMLPPGSISTCQFDSITILLSVVRLQKQPSVPVPPATSAPMREPPTRGEYSVQSSSSLNPTSGVGFLCQTTSIGTPRMASGTTWSLGTAERGSFWTTCTRNTISPVRPPARSRMPTVTRVTPGMRISSSRTAGSIAVSRSVSALRSA